MNKNKRLGLLLISAVGCCLLGATAAVYEPPVGEGMYILTPDAPKTPVVNGPSVFGVTPGAPFLYALPVSGERPMRFSADGLPAGLTLDEKTGIISGRIAADDKTTYPVVLKASNALGAAEKKFRIIVGDTICLTPPQGWNSWNAWGHGVDQQKVLSSAQAMVDKGLRNYGWTYINIDDVWQGERGGKYNAIQPNPKTFPDIKKLCDDVHALGLKIGIYSTPWTTSYAGFIGGTSYSPDGKWTAPVSKEEKKLAKTIGKYRFEQQDALQWAEWGIDYLKYDWKPNDAESIRLMGEALKASGRNIVFSLSNSAPLESVDAIKQYANCWRTTGDLKDRWNEKGFCLSMAQVWQGHENWLEKGGGGGPGHFPDADMLVVGDVIEKNQTDAPRPSRLTADEQYTHISLWSLWSCPMLIGCPIERMDAFTVKLLTNPEVLAIQQDAKGFPGKTVFNQNNVEVIVKGLEDGSVAIGLFNKNDAATVVTADWKAAGLDGPQKMRDLWRQKDVGTFQDEFSAMVPAHGVILVKTAN